jgi:POT family proton-dependent oligopeptide transporter
MGALVALVILVVLFYFVFGQNIIYSIIYGSGLTLAGLILTDKSLTKVETQRILVLYIVAFFVIFFWAAFEQAGSSLTFIADKQTDTNILGWNMPPSMVQNFNSIFVVAFALPFSALWLWLNKRNAEPISPVKQAIGLALIALGYFIIATQVKGLGTTGKIGIIWLVILYLLHTWGELCLSPIGLSLVAKLAPKRFASLLMGVWFLGNAAGYALTGTLGALLPPTGDKYEVAASKGIDLGAVLAQKASLTTEQSAFLAEKKISTVYPVFAGFKITNLYEFFMVFVILCGIASIVLYSLTPMLKKMMHGVK